MLVTNQKMLDVALDISTATTMTAIQALASCSNTLDGNFEQTPTLINTMFSGGNNNRFPSREACSDTCLRTISQPQIPAVSQILGQPGKNYAMQLGINFGFQLRFRVIDATDQRITDHAPTL